MTAAPVDFAHRVTTTDAVRHRRRGEALEGAIYDAVVDELAEIGYAALTIESVAARAHTGKASIYRRWPTKQELVVAAFCEKAGEAFDLVGTSMTATTTTRDALVHVGRRICGLVRGGVGEAIRAVGAESSRDADLAAALDARVGCPKREALLGVLQRGVARGEVRPEAADELIAEVLPAMLLTRIIIQGLPVSDDHIVRVVDDVVMPLLRPV
jgi:AcrR family transcriptional regulator